MTFLLSNTASDISASLSSFAHEAAASAQEPNPFLTVPTHTMSYVQPYNWAYRNVRPSLLFAVGGWACVCEDLTNYL